MSGIVAADSMWRHFMVWVEKKRGGASCAEKMTWLRIRGRWILSSICDINSSEGIC